MAEPQKPHQEDMNSRLDSTVIAMPLLDQFRDARANTAFHIIIDLNQFYGSGLDQAKSKAAALIRTILPASKRQANHWGVDELKSELTYQYLFARLTKREIIRLIERDHEHVIYKIWPDFEVKLMLTKSISTIKADAAHAAFSAAGQGICWAVIDSGIDGAHPHFDKYQNLDLSQLSSLQHMDFTNESIESVDPPQDDNGHGTHVAGIIAGEGKSGHLQAISRHRDQAGDVRYEVEVLQAISGIAPKCKLLSLKVLDAKGNGRVSNLIAALGYIQKVNNYGRLTRVHGVNMSVGYSFDAEWFACGQSPLCVEVDRLVRSGVVVVAAAGNTGYGYLQTASEGPFKTGLDLSINDPGNAELAITVGATHREMPHIYGVSYFSSKGPTGDGRLKPDLVAPGEKVISCAAGAERVALEQKVKDRDNASCDYRTESGTSMAAPHVAGAIAAFLSIRREFIGDSRRVKEIFLNTATDLKRARYFQGHGLVDLMRAIQSV